MTFKTEDKNNLLRSIDQLGAAIPLMDLDDRNFTASVLYKMAKIVDAYGPDHGVRPPQHVDRDAIRIGSLTFRAKSDGSLTMVTGKIPGMSQIDLEALVSRVIVKAPTTIVYWKDGTKTVVKCSDEDIASGRMNTETGLVYAIIKKLSGNKGNYNNVLKRLIEGAKIY